MWRPTVTLFSTARRVLALSRSQLSMQRSDWTGALADARARAEQRVDSGRNANTLGHSEPAVNLASNDSGHRDPTVEDKSDCSGVSRVTRGGPVTGRVLRGKPPRASTPLSIGWRGVALVLVFHLRKLT